MYTKDSKVNEEDLVLIETQNLKEKCGSCSNELILNIYWSKEGHQQKIECTKCGMIIWRSPIKRDE